MIHARRVPLDRIVLLKPAIGRLHQALRIYLSIEIIFLSRLQLRSQLVRYGLLPVSPAARCCLTICCSTLHHLMDADSAIVAKFDRPCLARFATASELEILLRPRRCCGLLAWIKHAKVVEKTRVGC